MKVLLAACLCIVPAVARPPTGTSSSSTSTASVHATRPKISILPASSLTTSNNSKREAAGRWLPIGPARSHSIFRVINVPNKSISTEDSNEMNEIPVRTLRLFSAPEFRTKEARELQYFAGSPEIPVPGHVHLLLHDIPFFDTLDHGKLVTSLQQRRKYQGLPLHVLKSLRPYFPFFGYE